MKADLWTTIRRSLPTNFCWAGYLALISLLPLEAWGACVKTGAQVACSGTATILNANSYLDTNSNLSVTVAPGTTMSALLGLGAVVNLTGTNYTLTNSGKIDPAFLGLVSAAATGVKMGNATTGGPLTIQNNSGATINGTGLVVIPLPIIAPALGGLALDLQSPAAGGAITINNSGVIGSTPLPLLGGVLADLDVIAGYGGAPVNMVNNATGVVTGRVGFGASAGNTFVNAGTVNGSISMGANSANTFTVVTGSAVNAAGGILGAVPSLPVVNFGFAAAGTVDGGAGGTNALTLQNSATGTGTGLTGTGTADAAVFQNFQNLVVNSGTWGLNGALVSNASTLNGGLVTFNASQNFGPNSITANGGAMQSATANLTLANNMSLTGQGVITQGTNNFALSGVLSGAGPLRNAGTNTLTLTGSNTFTGGVNLDSGVIAASADSALGDLAGALNFNGGTFRVLGNAYATTNRPMTFTALGGTIDVASATNTFTVNNAATGAGGPFTKAGAGTLALGAANNFTGVTLASGGLNVGNALALGTGTLTVPTTGVISSTSDLQISNPIAVNGTLNVTGANKFGLAGGISGTGSLVKQGTGELDLLAANTYSGGTTFNGGVTQITADTQLGAPTGALSFTGGTLNVAGTGGQQTDRSVSVTTSGTISVLDPTNRYAISQAITGAGTLAKSGAGTLALLAGNTLSGVTLNGGTVEVGNANALGTGAFTVAGAGNLTATQGVNNPVLPNAVALGNTLSVVGNGDTTLAGAISGPAGLIKNGTGVLTLGGVNSFAGGTTISGGTVRVAADAALGAAAGRLNFDNGTLSITGTTYNQTNRPIGFAAGIGTHSATINVASAQNTFAVNSAITGANTGTLTKTGAGVLALPVANPALTSVTLNQGGLNIGDAGALGAGPLTVAAAGSLVATKDLSLANQIALGDTLTIGGSSTLGLTGQVTGTGALVKQGTGVLQLAGANTYTGGTTVSGGSVQFTADNNLGAVGGGVTLDGGTLSVQGSPGLQTGRTVTLNATGGTVEVAAADATFTISQSVAGNGALTKTGAGTLELAAANALSGVALQAGTLKVGDNAALGTGTLNVAGAGTLSASKDVVLANNVALNNALTLSGPNSVTLGGIVSGNGALVTAAGGNATLQGANTYSGGTTVNPGTLTISADNNLGAASGALNMAGGTLNVNTPSDVQTNRNVTFTAQGGTFNVATPTSTFAIASSITGAGPLTKTGDGALWLQAANGNSAVNLNAGTIKVGNNLALGTGVVTVAGPGQLQSSADVTAANNIVLNDALTVGGDFALSLSGVISGTGGLTKQGAGTLTLQGANTYSGGTTVATGTVAGDSASLQGAFNIAAGANVAFNQGNDGTFTGTFSGAGTVDKLGTGTLTMSGVNSLSGLYNVAAGTLVANGGQVFGNGSQVSIVDSATLTLNGSESVGGISGTGTVQVNAGNAFTVGGSTDATFGGSLAGAGSLIKTGSAALTIGGASTLTGPADVQQGSLIVNGTLPSATVAVRDGATLGGTGQLSGAVTVAANGHLAGDATLGTLKLGSLALDAASQLDFVVGPVGGPPVVAVTGDLTLGGTLNIKNPAPLALGVSPIFTYGGALGANPSLAIGTLPAGMLAANLTVQTTVPGAINVVYQSTPGSVQFWGGAGFVPGQTAPIGGGGTWGVDSWTNTDATSLEAWNKQMAVFSGKAGTVNVAGTQLATGVQFTVDGYTLSGGAVAAANATSPLLLRANDGVTATIGSAISGAAGIQKIDPGTIALTGANSYTGNTQVLGGTLAVNQDANLGAPGATVELAGGTLQVAGTTFGTTARPITLSGSPATPASAGTLNIVDAANRFEVTAPMVGTGQLIKAGAGTLALNAANTYSGGTALNSGAIEVLNNSALGTGALAAADGTTIKTTSTEVQLANAGALTGNVTLDTGASLALGGVISGVGGLTKVGASTVQLQAANTFTGPLVLQAGTVTAGNNAALGTGTLQVSPIAAATTTLDSLSAVTLNNSVALNGALTIGGSNDLGLSGVITGSAPLTKNGAAALNLAGINTGFTGGVQLNAGTLIAGNGAALGTGTLTAQAGTSLDAGQALALPNNIALTGGSMAIVGTQDLALNGVISGIGGLTKSGATTLTLGGANTYTGGTTLNSGSLALGTNAAALGTGALTVAGSSNVLLDGVSLNNPISVASGAALNIATSQASSLLGELSGAGSLTKSGIAPLSVSIQGNGGLTGGMTIAQGSIDFVQSAGATPAVLTTNIVTSAAGNVTFDTVAAGTTLAGSVSGAGSLSKFGNGTLTLLQPNSYTGGTVVAQGILAGDTSSLQGDIENNADLIFNQTSDGVYAGALSGTGTLTKQGAGTLTLGGDGGLGGPGTVTGGALVVKGSIGLGGLSVATGGGLGGDGTIASDVSIASGGAFNLSDLAAPLNVQGNLTLAAATNVNSTLGSLGAANAASTVSGNVALDGILNVTDNGLQTGIYHLITYNGALTDNTLELGALPSAYSAANFDIQTVPGQVNVVFQETPGDIEFWNGAGTSGSGIVGGSGIWGDGEDDWTNASGDLDLEWNDKFAAFGGVGGEVTVQGDQSVLGMQFMVDAYSLVPSTSGGNIIGTGATLPITVSAGVTTNIAAPIGGAAMLDKQGPGTLVLNGADSYSGGTSVSNGTLQVSADNQLGASGTGVALNGGVLAVAGSGYTSTGRPVQINAPGGTISVMDPGNVLTLTQPVTGPGALIKSGAGTLALTAPSSYAGGTTIEAGALVGDSSSLQGAIQGNAGATLVFNQTSGGSFGGLLSGSLGVIKNGAGTLTLVQPTTYSGGTVINQGGLQGDTGSLQGNIVDNGQLIFAQNNSGTFTGSISGTGDIVKQGAGDLKFTTDQALTGIVQVQAGNVVLGTPSAGVSLPAAFTVASGAGLMGSGTVGSVNNQGSLTPQPALTINGNFQNGPTATVYLSPTSPQATPLVVNGAAALDGAITVAKSFPYTGAAAYSLVTATQGVTGTFATSTLPQFDFLTSALSYGPGQVQLTFTRNQTAFEDLAQTGNQRSVARALSTVDSSSALFQSVQGLGAGQGAATFEQLSGDSYAGLSSALSQGAGYARDVPLAHVRDCMQDREIDRGRHAGHMRLNDGSDVCRRQAWAEVIGTTAHQSGDSNVPGYRQRIGGLFVGASTNVGGGWRAGGAAGYTNSRVTQGSRNANADVDTYSLSLQAAKSIELRRGAINFRVGAAHSWENVDAARHFSLGSTRQDLKAKFHGRTLQVFGEVGYLLPLNDIYALEPFAGAGWSKQHTAGFSENGGIAALSGESKSEDVTTTTLGLRGIARGMTHGLPVALKATLGWQHAMGDVNPKRTLSFDTGASFTVRGTPIARDALVTDIGIDAQVAPRTSLGLAYGGQFGGGSRSHSGIVNMTIAF